MSMRTRILEATVALIRTEGLLSVTTKKVAAEAGCAEGTIFNQFGDKGALLAAVLSFGLPETRAYHEALRDARGRDLRTGLIMVIEALLTFYRASYPLIGSAIADHALFQHFSAAHRAAGSGPQLTLQRLRDYLSAQREAGRVNPRADLEVEALFLAGACQYAVWLELVIGAETLPHGGESLAERLVDNRMPTLAIAPGNDDDDRDAPRRPENS